MTVGQLIESRHLVEFLHNTEQLDNQRYYYLHYTRLSTGTTILSIELGFYLRGHPVHVQVAAQESVQRLGGSLRVAQYGAAIHAHQTGGGAASEKALGPDD